MLVILYLTPPKFTSTQVIAVNVGLSIRSALTRVPTLQRDMENPESIIFVILICQCAHQYDVPGPLCS